MGEGREELKRLIDCCVDAALEAGRVIRSVQNLREAAGGQDALGAELKDPTDTRSYLTIADVRAQKVFEDIVRANFPSVTIVGEEELSEESLQGWDGNQLEQNPEWPATKALLANLNIPEPSQLPVEWDSLNVNDLCLFVDPVDGTREFVQGRLHSCQTLVGIAWKSRAIVGIVGLPFHDGTVGKVCKVPASSAKGAVLVGITQVGVFGLPELAEHVMDQKGEGLPFFRTVKQEELVCVTSASNRDAVLVKARDRIGGTRFVAGGCGNKVLRLLTGQGDVTLLNLGTCLWDTCAPEALLSAAGGKLSTLGGFPVEYSAHGPKANTFGIIATSKRFQDLYGKSHDELCKTFREDFTKELATFFKPAGLLPLQEDEPQAFDIIRDLHGQPLTASNLSLDVFGQQDAIRSYDAPESQAVRYKQSVGCRVRFQLTNKSGPQSAFFKRAVFREMPYALHKLQHAPFKLPRDIKANQTEVEFLSSALARKFTKMSRVHLAIPYKTEQYVDMEHPIESRFTLLLPDFAPEEWTQHAHLSHDMLLETLSVLADFHAFFWLGHDPDHSKKDLASKLWKHGGYWHLMQQPKGQLTHITANWDRLQHVFRASSEFGEMLLQCSRKASEASHGITVSAVDGEATEMNAWENAKYATIIHGDAKSPNIFFRSQDHETQIGLIDFQWTGVGLGAVDVAYCIAASTDSSISQPGRLEGLLRHYYEKLTESFVKYGVAVSSEFAMHVLPWKVFESQFRFALLDLVRVAVADHWKTIDKDVLDSRQGKLAYNAYNKDFSVASWLVDWAIEAVQAVSGPGSVL